MSSKTWFGQSNDYMATHLERSHFCCTDIFTVFSHNQLKVINGQCIGAKICQNYPHITATVNAVMHKRLQLLANHPTKPRPRPVITQWCMCPRWHAVFMCYVLLSGQQQRSHRHLSCSHIIKPAHIVLRWQNSLARCSGLWLDCVCFMCQRTCLWACNWKTPMCVLNSFLWDMLIPWLLSQEIVASTIWRSV